MDVDPEGRIWVVRNNVVYRQGHDGWVRERVPGRADIEELAGIVQGTPWLRRGGSDYRHGKGPDAEPSVAVLTTAEVVQPLRCSENDSTFVP